MEYTRIQVHNCPDVYLVFEQELLHLDAEEPSFDAETSPFWSGNDVKHNVLKPGTENGKKNIERNML